MRQRAKVIPDATGVVLEIGIGSGLNLDYYEPSQIDHLIGIDPFPYESELHSKFEEVDFSTEFVKTSAEDLPFESSTIDTIVATYTFCTIDFVEEALDECRRVLKGDGKLLFVEHGLSPDSKVRKTQDRVNPIWRRLSGGCNLNRDMPRLIESNGFRINQIEEGYIPGWKPATWNSWGTAQPV